ncbi:MAG: sugar phosphate isomerase/epimerase family protein [Streptosporangiaceae bacterium]|jgi:sugar phosphate isomerase/epimerase
MVDIVSRIASLDLAGAEVFVDTRPCAQGELRRIFEDHGLQVFSMTPDNVDIAHAHGPTREQAIACYDRLIDFAGDLGSDAITCHEFVGRRRPHDDPAREWDRLADACRRITARAASQGINVVFEPLNRSLVSAVWTAERARALVALVDAPGFGIVLDTYHMHREENDPAEAIRSCGQFLRSFQISDSGRGRIGSGEIDFEAQMLALLDVGYNGPLILECSSLPGPSRLKREVDLERLEADLRVSREWLREFRAKNEA